MVEAFEGEDNGEKFKIIGTVALLSGGESGQATADEVPRVLVGLHEAETNPNFGCVGKYITWPIRNKWGKN